MPLIGIAMMKRLILALFVLCLPAVALAQTTPSIQGVAPFVWNGSAWVASGGPGTYLNASVALSTASTQVMAATPRVRAKVINNSGVGTTGGTGIVVWCRWTAAAVAGGLGSFALQPGGGGFDDSGPGVNQGALNCLSETGTPNLFAEQY